VYLQKKKERERERETRKSCEDTETVGEDGPIKIEAVRVRLPEAREHKKPPEIGRGRKPVHSEGAWPS